MSIGALGAALSGLRLSQQQLDVTARNISNAQNDGYTKKTQPVETLVAGGEVIGVQSREITRQTNDALQRQLWQQISTTASDSTKSQYLQRVDDINGKIDAETSVNGRLSALQASFSALSASPEAPIQQLSTVKAAEAMAASVKQLADGVQGQRNQAQQEMSSAIKVINGYLDDISDVNRRIVVEKAAGRSTATLEDMRDKAVTSLSKEMNVSSFIRGDGVMVVQTLRGTLLADTNSYQLNFTATPLDATSYYPASANGILVGSPTTGQDIANQPLGGRLGALLDLRDRDLPQYQAQIDELAHKMALRFDAQGLALFTDQSGAIPANSVPAAPPPVAPTAYVGFANNIRVNAAIIGNPTLVQQGAVLPPAVPPAPLAAGDSTVIRNILDFALGQYQDATGTAHVAFNTGNLGADNSVSTQLPAAATLGDYARFMQAFQSEAQVSMKTSQQSNNDFQTVLQKRLVDETGVNMDAEMSNMIVLQRSYSASAQVISTVSKLFDELLGAIR